MATDRHRVPAPTWIPINKASLASWRSGPTEMASPHNDEPTDVFVVRFANATAAAVQAAVSGVDGARFVGMGAPRAIAKGTTPHGGPADPPPGTVESMSPGVSPATKTNDPPLPPPLEGGSSPTGMPAMTLGPAMSEALILSSALHCIVARDAKTAGEAAKKVLATCDNAVSETLQRPVPGTCTVVLKGVPLSIKHDRLWQELSALQAAQPSYLRFHRNDRGLFKNVVYVKFSTAVEAELGRLELERLSVGGRPLKVELKKPKPTTVEENARLEAARREDLKVAMTGALEAFAADLLRSTENEGFSLPKTSLSKDDQKYLKGLCQAHDFSFDVGSAVLTVKKKVARAGVSPGAGPARTPPVYPATPSTHAADQADAAGMRFRGIRHWREQRAGITSNALGLHRCLGPADGKPAWSAGRGRPQR